MLKDGTTPVDPRLGRIPKTDLRNNQHLIRTLIEQKNDGKLPTLRSYTWPCDQVLDQGQEGACVGFGFAHELIAVPRPVEGVTNQYAREELYWNIQRNDEWPGGSYPGADPQYEGTSVLDGAKWMKSDGWYDEYRWAENERDLALALGHHGPAVIGVDWYEGMFEPDEWGFLNLTGSVQGGHCILVKGVKIRGETDGYYTVHNSWGESWGVDGTARISRQNMDYLLKSNGEACVPVVRMPRTKV